MIEAPVVGKMVRRIRVFVASPGDVHAERAKVRGVIERVNERHALHEGMLLDPWLWELDALPGIGRVQGQIDRYLDDAVIVVLILWNRLGTPTGDAASGTVEEFERAVERFHKTGWPRILVYYCGRKSTLETESDIAQRGLVLKFRNDHKDILPASYDTPEEFAEKLETHLDQLVDEIADIPAGAQTTRRYRKVLYVKVTYLGERKPGAAPFYQRIVDRLEGEDRVVGVYDEAVYYTLEIFPDKKKPDARTDRSRGVVDPRMVIPLQNPLKYSDKDAALVTQAAQMEVSEECDTLLTVSHFENGLQGSEQDFATRIAEDAEYARLVVDFSSIPDAPRFVIPKTAYWITAAGGQQEVKIVSFGEGMFMASCENAKKDDLLKLTFTFDRGRLKEEPAA